MVKKHVERYHKKLVSAKERKRVSFLLAGLKAYDPSHFIKSYRFQDVFEPCLFLKISKASF